MLKIKDNVELKELEKFGFENKEYSDYLIKYSDNRIRDTYYFIEKKARILCINTEDNDTELDNTLYDLIQAGLVEKIEE